MELLNEIMSWFKHPSIVGVVKYLLLVAAILLIIRYLRGLIKQHIPNTGYRYKSQKATEVVGYAIIIILSISYFTGNIQDFTLAVGLFSAGIAITLQELILSIAGSFYIFFVKVYAPGDRIEINGIKGDVIDIDSIYTTLMEIGQWVSSDNYSGRIVKLSNAFVFKGPVYNYSSDFPFVWDEFNLPVRYGSDVDLTKKIIVEAAVAVLSDYTRNSTEEWKAVVEKYYIEDALIEPTLAITLTDNWMQFNLRYIVDFKKRRVTKNKLHEKIHRGVEASEGKVKLASATFEVVKLPEMKIDLKNPQP